MRFDVTGKSAELGPRAVAAAAARGDLRTRSATRRWELMLSTSGAPRWQISGLELRHRPHRRPPAAQHHRALAVRQPSRTGRIRCICTGSTSGCWNAPPAASTRASGRGRTRRWSTRRDRDRAAALRALPRPLRVPLPQHGAPGEGDDAPDGGGVMLRSVRCALAIARCAWSAPPGASAQDAAGAGLPPRPRRATRRSARA